MNFIEKYLNFSPGYGDRSLEFLLLIALVSIIALAGLRFFHNLADEDEP
jgi:hypothetical protein